MRLFVPLVALLIPSFGDFMIVQIVHGKIILILIFGFNKNNDRNFILD